MAYYCATKSVGSAYQIQLDKESQSGKWHRGLPTVGCGLPAEGCPPRAGWGLWCKIYWFSLHKGVWLLGRSVIVFSLNLAGSTDHTTKMHKIWRKTAATSAYYWHRKGIFRLNILVTTAKYFHTSDLICFCKSLIVSTLVLMSLVHTQLWNKQMN